MEIDQRMITLAEEAIKKNDKCKLLMEMLMTTLGFTIDDDINIFHELKKANDEYHEAVKLLNLVVQETYKKQTQNGIGVS